MKWVDYIGLFGGALLLQPVLSLFGIGLSKNAIQIIIIFIISFFLIDKGKGLKDKFNTVFAENSDEMMRFVERIREEMPLATHKIVRMASDLQDLLVPLGLARDKATDLSKGFLDVANKIGAFNDADPSDVLEAIKSGLAGSSEPLRRFGINALETALEARALSMGLLDVNQKSKI